MGTDIFNAFDKRASKVRVANVESVLENQFGDDLANLTSGNTSSDVSADINALKDVVNLENWGNLLGVDVVLSSPSNIGAPRRATSFDSMTHFLGPQTRPCATL